MVDEAAEDSSRPIARLTDDFVPLLESNDPVMRLFLEKARRAAVSDATILLTGERGTGKDVLARQIHRWSSRAECPFVTARCTGHSENLFESELFGQMRGALNGADEDKRGLLEAAHGGSIFFDEVSELTAPLQNKLLHFLKERTFVRSGSEDPIAVDARIIAASNHDLASEVATRQFREDLDYRLGVVTLRVPALRERPGDILPLATRMLAGASVRKHCQGLRLSPEASSALVRFHWPGNIRELRNAIECAVASCPSDVVTAACLPDVLSTDQSPPASTVGPSASLYDIEREHILRVIAESPTLENAASKLGINVATLWRRRKRYGLFPTSHLLKS